MSSDEGYQELLTKSSSKKYDRGRVVSILKDHPYYRSSNKGRIAVSRLLMAEHLGRNLTKDDIVIFKNSDKGDEIIDNLLLVSIKESVDISTYRTLLPQLDKLESRVSLYEQKIISYGIDPSTMERKSSTDRYWEVDRDAEAFRRARRNRASDSEEYNEDE